MHVNYHGWEIKPMSVMESASCPAPDDFLTAFELDASYAFTSQC